MRKIAITLLTGMLIVLACEVEKKLNKNDFSEIDSFIANNYSNDAKELYFNEIINNSEHPNYNEPVLDTTEINEILAIIQAVYQSESPQRDTVFEVFNIHTRYCYSFNSIMLKVETGQPAIKNLAKGRIPTGNAELDNILTAFQFDSVKTSYSYPDFPWLTIYSSGEYNMIPVVKEFNELPSIVLADAIIGCVGDGHNISLQRGEVSDKITFSIGWGDCPAGCIYHKYWEFIVENKKAEFVRSYEN